MFLFNAFFRKKEDERVRKLEKRVEDLENALLEFSVNFKRLAALSLKTGEELHGLVEHVSRLERAAMPQSVHNKKTDDFYN